MNPHLAVFGWLRVTKMMTKRMTQRVTQRVTKRMSWEYSLGGGIFYSRPPSQMTVEQRHGKE